MSIVDCLLLGLIGIAIITAFVAACAWLDNIRYDEWVREFEERGGIQWPIADEPIGAAHEYVLVAEVLDGSEVVSHTVMAERRSNRL